MLLFALFYFLPTSYPNIDYYSNGYFLLMQLALMTARRSRSITPFIWLFLLVYQLYSGLSRKYKMDNVQNNSGGYDSSNSHFAYPVVTIFASLYFVCYLHRTNNYRFKTASLSSSTSSLEMIFLYAVTVRLHEPRVIFKRCKTT